MKKLIFLFAVLIPFGLSAQVIRPLSYTTIQKLTADTLYGTHIVFTTMSGGAWTGPVVAGQYGGTGVANTGKTITLGGNFTHTGAHTLGLTTTNNTSVTLPTTGTLATLGGAETVTGVKKFTGHNLYAGEIVTATDTLALAVATHYTVLADATSSAILLTLPDAATCEGAIIRVKCINADAEVKIITAGGTIDATAGATGITLSVHDGREFQSNGTNWYIISKF